MQVPSSEQCLGRINLAAAWKNCGHPLCKNATSDKINMQNGLCSFSVHLFFPELSDALNCTLWQIGLLGNDEESQQFSVSLLRKLHTGTNVSCPFTKKFGVCLTERNCLPGSLMLHERRNNKAEE